MERQKGIKNHIDRPMLNTRKIMEGEGAKERDMLSIYYHHRPVFSLGMLGQPLSSGFVAQATTKLQVTSCASHITHFKLHKDLCEHRSRRLLQIAFNIQIFSDSEMYIIIYKNNIFCLCMKYFLNQKQFYPEK